MEYIELHIGQGKNHPWLIRKDQVADVFVDTEDRTNVTQIWNGEDVEVNESYEKVKALLLGEEVKATLTNDPNDVTNIMTSASVLCNWLKENGYE